MIGKLGERIENSAFVFGTGIDQEVDVHRSSVVTGSANREAADHDVTSVPRIEAAAQIHEIFDRGLACL